MIKRKNLSNWLAGPCVALCSSGAWAADGLTLSVGTDYASGKYGGTERTEIFAIPLGAKYVTGPVTFRLSTSWLHVTGTRSVFASGLGGVSHSGGNSGPGSSNSGSGSSNSGSGSSNSGSGSSGSGSSSSSSTSTARTTDSGIGDIVVAVVYKAVDNKGLLVDLTGKIKFATASESKGLGSGKNDYAAQIEAEQAIGKGYLNGGIGYKWLGDPAGVDLRNVVYGTVGGGFKPTADTTVGISYDQAQAARRGNEAPREVSLYASQRLTKNMKLNGYLFKGLSDSTPDWGAGVGLAYNF